MTDKPEISRGPIPWQDCDYMGKCPKTGKFTVHEQLYPEGRGFIVHEFETEAEGRALCERR